MEKDDGTLDLNIDTLNDGKMYAPSLNDLYGIPVFTTKTNNQIQAVEDSKQQQILELKKETFYTIDETSQKISDIKEQVFTTKVIAKEEIKVEPKEVSKTHYFILGILVFFVLSISIIYANKKIKERKKYLESINNFY